MKVFQNSFPCICLLLVLRKLIKVAIMVDFNFFLTFTFKSSHRVFTSERKLNIYKKPKHRSAYNQFQPEMATYSGKHSILPRNPRFGGKTAIRIKYTYIDPSRGVFSTLQLAAYRKQSPKTAENRSNNVCQSEAMCATV